MPKPDQRSLGFVSDVQLIQINCSFSKKEFVFQSRRMNQLVEQPFCIELEKDGCLVANEKTIREAPTIIRQSDSDKIILDVEIESQVGYSLYGRWLPDSFNLLSINQEVLHRSALFEVLNLFFFQAQKQDAFFSYADTGSLIYVIVQDNLFRSQNSPILFHSSMDNYKAILLESHDDGNDVEQTKYIQVLDEFMKPLVQNGIGAVLLKTANPREIAIILVPEEDITKALQCIDEMRCNQQDVQNIFDNEERDNNPTEVDRPAHDFSLRINPQCAEIPVPSHTRQTFDLVTLPHAYRLCSFSVDEIPLCTHALLSSFFFSDGKGEQDSLPSISMLTIMNGLVTVIIEGRHTKQFPDGILKIHENVFSFLEVEKGPVDATHSSIIGNVMTSFGGFNVPVLFLTTISTDFVLVDRENIDFLFRNGFSVQSK